jgi:hypothetical protein
MSDKEYEKMSASEKKKEDWMNSKWRPMMGWSYMLTCIADFVIFPVLWSILQSVSKGQVNVQWQPITLQGAGLYHIAMGAVLGIAAYGRTQEKLGGANNGGVQLPSNVGTTYQPPAPVGQSAAGGFGSPAPVTNPGDPNPWVVQAALEAHLHQRHQAALVAVQDLERQRLAGSEQHQQPE